MNALKDIIHEFMNIHQKLVDDDKPMKGEKGGYEYISQIDTSQNSPVNTQVRLFIKNKMTNKNITCVAGDVIDKLDYKNLNKFNVEKFNAYIDELHEQLD